MVLIRFMILKLTIIGQYLIHKRKLFIDKKKPNTCPCVKELLNQNQTREFKCLILFKSK